jgi:hypothetical protein
MGCVGLIDITVGNAARLGASQRTCSRAIAPATSDISECRRRPHNPGFEPNTLASFTVWTDELMGTPGAALPAKATEINLAIS